MSSRVFYVINYGNVHGHSQMQIGEGLPLQNSPNNLFFSVFQLLFQFTFFVGKLFLNLNLSIYG